MTMLACRTVGNVVATLSTIAGSLLIGAAVAHSLFTGFVIPETSSTLLWTMFIDMFPIPGGTTVPEIDPGSAANAVTLLIGLTMLFVGGRRRR